MTALKPLFVILALLVTPIAAPAQQGPDPQAAPGATPAQQTRETIMARQKGLALHGDYSLTRDRDAPASPPPGTVPQLGTRGLASDSDIWRALKQGAQATPSSSSARGQLIQVIGEDWRQLRRAYLTRYAGWAILGVICLIALFYLIRGRIRIEGGRSGRTIPRFSLSHRVAHWLLAGTFILMALSGLILLLGRTVLIPVIGREANAVLAQGAIWVHNYLGPVFILSLVFVIIRFMKGNFFQRADLDWIRKGGGLFGGHASSHHYNFGEKTWYWVVTLVGLMMAATGLLLLFPFVVEDLRYHQAATLLHALGALLMICFSLGHMYVGSIGMEGSLDSMLHGEVDENWAREHHDLWYEEVTGKPAGHHGARPDQADEAAGGRAGDPA